MKKKVPYHLLSYSNFPSSILVSGREFSGSEGPKDETPEVGSSAESIMLIYVVYPKKQKIPSKC